MAVPGESRARLIVISTIRNLIARKKKFVAPNAIIVHRTGTETIVTARYYGFLDFFEAQRLSDSHRRKNYASRVYEEKEKGST